MNLLSLLLPWVVQASDLGPADRLLIRVSQSWSVGDPFQTEFATACRMESDCEKGNSIEKDLIKRMLKILRKLFGRPLKNPHKLRLETADRRFYVKCSCNLIRVCLLGIKMNKHLIHLVLRHIKMKIPPQIVLARHESRLKNS